MAILVSEQQAQIGEFLPVVAGHFPEEGTLAVYHLIVGERQNKVFVKCVPDAEGKLIMMIFAVDGIERKIFQRVVHPAHVPLQAKAQSAEVSRPRYHWPGGGLFGNGLRTWMIAVHGLTQIAQKIDSLDIFP